MASTKKFELTPDKRVLIVTDEKGNEIPILVKSIPTRIDNYNKQKESNKKTYEESISKINEQLEIQEEYKSQALAAGAIFN